jgi:hypothetical protein
MEVTEAEGPGIAVVVTKPPHGVKRKSEDEPEHKDASNADEAD